MSKNIFLTYILFLTTLVSVNAQDISGKIIDSETKYPIPYVNIQLDNNKGTITNEEGLFSLTITEQNSDRDSIHFSSIGYANKRILVKKVSDTIIEMHPEALELSKVFVTGEKLTAEEVIEKVKENLASNYTANYTKNRFFMRESFKQYYKKLNFDFKKSSIKEVTKGLIDSMMTTIPKTTSYHNETLGDFYSKQQLENKKLNIIKTSKLYNKNQEVSFENLQKKFMQVLNDNVKKDSYLKIKSGIFGTKIGVDSIVNTANNIDDVKDDYEQNNYFDARKRSVNNLVSKLFYEEESPINVIIDEGKYDFVLEDFVYIESSLAYVLSFTPGWRADIKGKLYVNTDDFAVVRIDYENAEPVYDKEFNMLGVNLNHTDFKGTMIFGKQTDSKYNLKYISHENGRSFKLDRPLTIIEKNKNVKGRRKQNELKLQMQFNIIDSVKRELVVFSSENSSSSAYKAIPETKKVDVKYFSSYNPDFWNGYNIIEPNQAIKEFTAIE